MFRIEKPQRKRVNNVEKVREDKLCRNSEVKLHHIDTWPSSVYTVIVYWREYNDYRSSNYYQDNFNY